MQRNTIASIIIVDKDLNFIYNITLNGIIK